MIDFDQIYLMLLTNVNYCPNRRLPKLTIARTDYHPVATTLEHEI